MANPRIEEVSDDEDFDDPDEMDVDAFDFAKPKTGGLQSSVSDLPEKMQALLRESQAPPPSTAGASRPSLPAGMSDKDREQFQRAKLEESKRHQCIYPVYFDSTRSREEGRRVKKEDSVANPLAREIVDALSHIGTTMQVPLQIVFEPSKTHPKDWANPGRVKVLIKKDGRAVNSKIKNKHHLYKLIAEYLKTHPTTEESPMRLRLQGMPMPTEKIPPPAVPCGFKMGTILPLHSPAISGGGVSENFLQDMMAGGQLPPGMEGMAGMLGGGDGPSGGGAPKKMKRKIIRA